MYELLDWTAFFRLRSHFLPDLPSPHATVSYENIIEILFYNIILKFINIFPLPRELSSSMPDRGGSLKRLHRPAKPLGVHWIGLKEKLRFQDHGGPTLIALNAGLYETSQGIYLGHGQ